MKTSLIALATFAAILFPAALRAEKVPPSLEPQALASLKRMSATLGEAKAFTCRLKNIFEVPAETGQFLTLFSKGEITLQRPDKLRARLSGEAPPLDFYYDGATVTAFAPGSKVCSVAKAPTTIDAMLSGLQAETGIRLATAPLLFSNPYAVLTRGLISAIVVGPAVVDGVPCEHLAFRSPGVNWELWLEANDRALPRRLAVTFTDRTNFPRTLVEFTSWNLHPWLHAGNFTFRRPAGVNEIPFAGVLKSSDRR